MIELNFWNFLFIVLASQGCYLALLIALRRKMVNGNRFLLSAFILIFSIILFFWVGFWNEFEFRYAHFNMLYNPFPFLLGPTLYLYFRSFFFALKKTDILHYLPAVLVILYLSPFYILSEQDKIEILQNARLGDVLWQYDFVRSFFKYLSNIHIIIYTILLRGIYLKGKRLNQVQITAENLIWLRTILVLFGSFVLLEITAFIIVEYYDLSINVYYFSALSIGLLIYLLGYLSYNKPQFIRSLENSFIDKYKRSGLDPEMAEPYLERINVYLNDEKPYLNEKFKLNDLAKAVNIPSHHISELLNQYHHQSFSSLINSLRVEEAKRLLVSNQYDNKKVSVIGYDVGFKSRTTFYQWFKKITGQSPANYQRDERVVQNN